MSNHTPDLSRSFSISVALSAAGLANINRNNYENDFTFQAGGRDHACPSFVAEFLSPRISALRRSDCTVSEYRVSSVDSGGYFESFLSLGFGLRASIGSGAFGFFRELCVELENWELWDKILGSAEAELGRRTAVDRLEYHDLVGSSSACEGDVESAASNFMELSDSAFSRLSIDRLREILSHKSLRLESEDWLYGQIQALVLRDSRYCPLLELVGFEYLLPSSMEDFIGLIATSIDFLTVSVWTRLSPRLLAGARSYVDASDRAVGKDFQFDSGSPFGGIIASLSAKHGGNVHDLGIVSVTASSVLSGYPARNAVDFGSVSGAATDSFSNSWICYDFKGMRVNVSHYSIRSRKDADCNHLRSWTVEGSVDEDDWVELDQQENRAELVGMGKSSTFPVKQRHRVQKIRLRQHGKNSNGNHHLNVSAFELFGTLLNAK
jgi:hypothetical protein